MGLTNNDEYVDYTKVDPEVLRKMLEWEKNQPAQKQLRAIQDIADMFQDLIGSFDSSSKDQDKFKQDLGAVLIDIRESLSTMKAKEVEIPDYAEPVVEAIGKLEKAFAKIDVKPVFTPNIKVDAPAVNVNPPSVDLKGIEKVLKTDLPKAFESAIKAIPQTEIPEQNYTPLLEKFDSMLEKLSDIDIATRMKPQVKVYATNSDNQLIVDTQESQKQTERYDYDDSTTIYVGSANIGVADATSSGWTIVKYNLTDSNDASGKVATDVSWTNRASGTYA